MGKKKYIEQYELDNYLSVQKRINDFCKKVVETMEKEYPDVLNNYQNCVVENCTIINDLVEIDYYSQSNIELCDEFYITLEEVMKGDVKECCKNVANEARELDVMIDISDQVGS